MKIKIEKIETPWYAPREEFEDDFIEELAVSLKKSGQWDPVMVRRNLTGQYELIAGAQRLEAAKKLKWNEVEASVIDVSEQEAAMLALETNLMRQNLKEIEEGKAIKEIMDRLKLNQSQVAERLGKSDAWVSKRLSIALDVIAEVQNAILRGAISVTQAVIISQLPKNNQAKFLNLVIQKQIKANRKFTAEETRLELKRFLNDTIYTIGYEGWDLDDFLDTLKKNKIEVLVDIRDSTASMHKPEFSEKILKKRVIEAKIKYLGRKEFGVPYDIREAYIDGGLSNDCFRQWYIWHATKRVPVNLDSFVNEIKDLGKSVLMCSERYPEPKGRQKHYCHRDLLAKLILKTGLFEKGVDL